MHRDADGLGQERCGHGHGRPLLFLFALANLVVVTVKLFKPNKMLSMIGCGVCFLGMIFTLGPLPVACFGMFAGEKRTSARHWTQDPPTARALARPSPAFRLPAHRARPGWASSLLPLSVISLLPLGCSQAWRPPMLLLWVGIALFLPRACATRPPRSKGCGATVWRCEQEHTRRARS